jgi:hypothetical protein
MCLWQAISAGNFILKSSLVVSCKVAQRFDQDTTGEKNRLALQDEINNNYSKTRFKNPVPKLLLN